MEKKLLVYLILTFGFEALYTNRLLHENAARQITSGISLARFLPVLVFPALVAVLLGRFPGGPLKSLGISIGRWKKTVLIFAVAAVLLALGYWYTPSILFLYAAGALLLGTLGPAIGWFGYFSEQLYAAGIRRAGSLAAGAFAIFMTPLWVFTLDLDTKAPLGPAVFGVVTFFTAGYLSARLRRRVRNVWPVVGVLTLTLVFLSLQDWLTV
jgi:hypothetical protein